jgi:hypothetical protein
VPPQIPTQEEESTAGSVRARPLNRPQLKWWLWAAVILLAVGLWAPRLSGPIDLRWDGGVYYLLGTSLATGHGYRIPSEPGSPEAVQYPPLLPAFVALHARALGTIKPEIVAPSLRISYAIIFLLYALAVAALAQRFLPPLFALVATFLCLLYSETIFFSDLLYAELPFALVSVLLVLSASGAARSARTSWLREGASFVFAAAGFLLRTAGAVLLIAWVLDSCLRRQWRTMAIRFALALLPVVAWQLHVARVRASEDYLHPAYAYQRAAYQYNNVSYSENARLIDPFHPERGRLHPLALAKRFVTNAPRMIAAAGETVGTKKRAWARLFFDLEGRREIIPVRRLIMGPILVLSILSFAGVLILVRRKAFLIVLIILGSVVLALTTPWREQFTRYLVPLGSFLAIATVLAVIGLRDYLEGTKMDATGKLIARSILYAGLGLTLAAQGFAVIKMFRERASPEGRLLLSNGSSSRLFVHDAKWQNLERAAQWIGLHSRPDAILATSAPHLFYLFTGRLAVIPPLLRDAGQVRNLLDGVPVSYVVVDQIEGLDMSRTYARPAVQGAPQQWQPVFTSGHTVVYARANDTAVP